MNHYNSSKVFLLLILLSIYGNSSSQVLFSYDVNGNRIRQIHVSTEQCDTCAVNAKTYFVPQAEGRAYRWQVNLGNGFNDLTDDTIYSGSNKNLLILKSPPTSWYGNVYRCKIVQGTTVSYSNTWVLKFSLTWKGTVSDQWENPKNWSCNKLPDRYTDVIISGQIASKLSSDATVRTLTLNPAANLIVQQNNKLTIVK